MRIIAGKHRGRVLNTFKGKDIRPTSDKAREALFSILQNDVPNSTFLDLFAGTGIVGFEALSRGAEKVVMVDSSKQAYGLICDNASKLNLEVEAYNIPAMYALNKFITLKKKFDIIFLDPPYSTNLGEEAMEIIMKNNLLNDDGVIILEKGNKLEDDFSCDGLTMYDKRQYGVCIFRMYAKTSDLERYEAEKGEEE